MVRWVIVAITLLLTTAAFAETVPVRGGEHEGFTRLVLDIPRPVKWTLETGENLRLQLDGLRAEFDTSAALQKLNASRVKTITQARGSSELVVALNCRCEAKSYFVGTKMLVIDIYSAVDTPNTQDEPAVLAKTEPEKATPKATKAPRYTLPLFTNPNLAMASGNTASPAHSNPNALMAQMPDNLPDEASRLQETEQRLVQQMSRVASQGLLSPNPNQARAAAQKMMPTATPEEEQVAPERLHLPDPPGLNMRAVSSIDRDLILSNQGHRYSVNGERCMPDHMLAVQTWMGEGSFSERVGMLRRQQVGEFDKRNSVAALELAQTYISYGLGVEALQALDGLTLPETQQYILAMADVVEDGTLQGRVPNGWFLDCDGAAAMWAALASESLPPSASIKEEAILRTFSALQPSVRVHLGPNLFAKFQARNPQSNMLPQLLKLMERGSESEDPEVQLASAGLARISGDEVGASKTLDEVIEESGENAPVALIEKIDMLTSRSQKVSDQLQTLADAYAKEYRGDALEPRLARANSMALASQNRFEAAFGVLDQARDILKPEPLESAANYLVEAIATTPDDMIFLKHAFAAVEKAYPLQASVENKMAERLLGLGFADQAQEFLLSAAEGDVGRARRLLRAKAALATERPRQAEAELLGLTGEDAEQLRSQARLLNNDHRGAQISYATLGKVEQAAEQAWLGADWEALGDIDAQNWQTEQRLVAQTTPQDPTPDRVLNAGRSMLTASSDLRSDIATLLSRHEVTDALPQQ